MKILTNTDKKHQAAALKAAAGLVPARPGSCRTRNWAVVLAGVLALASVGVGGAETSAPGTDWPQWRGPMRDGVAAPGPKLPDSWGAKGFKQLWKSEPIGGEGDGDGGEVGGYGSVSVAEGKAVFYANCKFPKGKVVFPTQALINLGWREDLTDALIQKIDEAYNSPKRTGLKQGKALNDAALETYAKEFLATLDADTNTKFGTFIHDRLTIQHFRGKYAWDELYGLYKMRDKLFDTMEAWNVASGNMLYHHNERAGAIRSVLDMQALRYTDTVTCLDAATGRTLWKREFPGNADGDVFNYRWGASGTPAISGGKCYVSGSAGVYCLAVNDGTVVWQKPAPFTLSSPLVLNGVVYVSFADALVAYDASNGDIRWRLPEVTSVYASVVGWTSGGTSYLIGTSFEDKRSFLFCVDAAKGALLWKAVGGKYDFMLSTPAISGDLAVVFSRNSLHAYKLSPLKAEEAWASKAAFDNHGFAMPLIYEGYVYVTGGHYVNSGIHCFDLKTGETKWEVAMAGLNCPSPLAVDGRIIANATGEPLPQTVMFRATPAKYEELGRTALTAEAPLNLNASPAVANGKLFLRLKDSVACYDLTASE